MATHADLERFFTRVLMPDGIFGCWVHTRSGGASGHTHFSVNGKSKMAHRYSYEEYIGPIPEGLVLDHVVCNYKRCVNPWHTEPVTNEVNTSRAMQSKYTRRPKFLCLSCRAIVAGGMVRSHQCEEANEHN